MVIPFTVHVATCPAFTVPSVGKSVQCINRKYTTDSLRLSLSYSRTQPETNAYFYSVCVTEKTDSATANFS